MADEIIDILHRLSYEVDDTPIREANGEIKKSIEYTKKLEDANADLKKQIEATNDAAKKADLQKTYQKNEAAIKDLKDSIKVMGGETDKTAKKTETMGKGLTKTGKAAGALKSELKDVIRETTGLHGAFGDLAASVAGPVGIVAAIGASTVVLVNAIEKYGSLEDAIKNLMGTETEHFRQERIGLEIEEKASAQVGKSIADAKILEQVIADGNKPRQVRLDAMKEYNDKYADVIKLQEQDLDQQPKLKEAFEKNNKLLILRFTIMGAKSVIEDYGKKIFESEVSLNKVLSGNLTLWQTTKQLLSGPGSPLAGTSLNPILKAADDVNKLKESQNEAIKQLFADIDKYLAEGGTMLEKVLGIDPKTGKVKDADKIKSAMDDFTLPFLSSIDEAAIKDYRNKLQEMLTLFDNHWAAYKQKSAEAYRNGEISQEEFNRRTVQLEAERLQKQEDLLKQFAQKNPYVQFFQSQLTALQKTQGDLTEKLRVKLPDEAGLAPMDKAWQDYVDRQQKATNEGIKQLIKYASAYQYLSNAAIGAFQDIVGANEQSTAQQLEIQQTRIERAQQIADRGNAEALQKEEERQNKLQKQHEQQVHAEIALNSIMTESNAIAAVVRAAADPAGGGLLAPATIALVIAAIAGGIVAVNNIAKDVPGFRDGVIDLQGAGTSKSDSIPARLSKHESVMTAEATQRHKDILERMNMGEQFMLLHKELPLLMAKPMDIPVGINHHQDQLNAHMLSELKDIKHAIRNKKEYGVTIDRRGIYATVTEFMQQAERRKKL